LSPAERNRIVNGGTSVNVPADIHRAGPTYGGKNTPALISSDKADLASAALRDADAMVENARRLAPEHAQVLEESASAIKQRSNAEYDQWLRRQLDDD
jgi:filamentous hemagglutinin